MSSLPTSAVGSARSSTSTRRRPSASCSHGGWGFRSVDRGAVRELRGDHPRPRRPAGDRARGERGRKITAVRVRLTAAMGAYMQLVSPGIPLLGAWLYAGCYDVQGYDFECVGVFTNTTPTDAYRGAGRPRRRMRSSGRWTRSHASWTWIRSSSGARTSSASFPLRLRPDWRSTRATSTPRSTRRSSSSTTTGSVATRPSGAGAATGSRSASASRPTSRCAASPRRASSGRSATAPAAGTLPPSASSPPAPFRS